jgi:hypothetical protein
MANDPLWGCVAFVVEIDDENWAKREVGLYSDGRVVHKCRSEVHRYGSQGFWTGFLEWEVVDALESADVQPVTKADFEALWSDTLEPPPEHQRRRGWRRALDNISW